MGIMIFNAFPVTIVGDMRSSCVIQSYIAMGKAFMRHAHNNRWCLRYNLSTSAGLEAMAFPSEYSSTRLWLPFIHFYPSPMSAPAGPAHSASTAIPAPNLSGRQPLEQDYSIQIATS